MRDASAAAHLTPHQFKAGQPSANPAGRPKGARNKLQESVIQALYEDFTNHGVAAIQRVRERRPEAYLAAVVSLLPKRQEKIESPFTDLTDDEIEQLEKWLKASRAKHVVIENEPQSSPQTAEQNHDPPGSRNPHP